MKILTFVLGLLLCSCVSNYESRTDMNEVFTELSDIGNPQTPGKMGYDSDNKIYTLSGSGENIWFGNDSFSFLSKAVSGDFSLSSSLSFLGENPNHRKIGLMIRSGLSSDAIMVCCTVHGDGSTSFQYRDVIGGDVKKHQCKMSFGDYMSLQSRNGKIHITVSNKNGDFESWSCPFQIDKDARVGMFICSHDNERVESCLYSNVNFVLFD